VERARFDELVGALKIEDECGTGEVEHAVDGVGCGSEVWAAPEHLFVWCGRVRMERPGAWC
jgi:hypothetical protein